MRIGGKNIVLSVVALVLVAYLVAVAVWSSKWVNTLCCPSLDITITDSTTRLYVTSVELTTMLQQQHLYPVGQPLASISTQRIENAILAHPMVRKAQCYTTTSGEVRVRLTQREPMLRVVTAGETYFVDTDHRRMPVRASVTKPVLVATGEIGERLACEELADMADWLMHDRYWKTRIIRIGVARPHYVYLVQKADETVEESTETRLVLGDVSGYKRKLNKVRDVYEHCFKQIGWRTYREIDLRFHGQVVGRK